jgi:hypothetical protein
MYTVFIIWVIGGDVETEDVSTEAEARAIVLTAIASGAYSARFEPPKSLRM